MNKNNKIVKCTDHRKTKIKYKNAICEYHSGWKSLVGMYVWTLSSGIVRYFDCSTTKRHAALIH